MPTSALQLAPLMVNLVETASPHRRVLDVGPGYGKYGLLLREYLNVKPERIDAVEAWPPYVTPMLRAIYDQVIIDDVLCLPAEQLAEYDLVFMSEVIEHLGKGSAKDLLDRIPGWVVISTPLVFFEQGEGLPPTEQHVSHWTKDDFAGRADVLSEYMGGLIVRLRPLAPL